MYNVNFIAIVLSAIASMVIGSIWYGPLFGKAFMKAMGMDKWSEQRKAEEKKKMGKMYLIQFLASVLMFYVVAMLVLKLDMMSVSGGMMVAFWAWLGFVVPVKLGDAIWGGSMTLFWLGAGNMLLTLLAAGAVIGGMA